jgi:hypothetical protein
MKNKLNDKDFLLISLSTLTGIQLSKVLFHLNDIHTRIKNDKLDFETLHPCFMSALEIYLEYYTLLHVNEIELIDYEKL